GTLCTAAALTRPEPIVSRNVTSPGAVRAIAWPIVGASRRRTSGKLSDENNRQTASGATNPIPHQVCEPTSSSGRDEQELAEIAVPQRFPGNLNGIFEENCPTTAF